MPTAEVITIGTELLLGEIVDTNTRFIARALRDEGIGLYRTATIGDNEYAVCLTEFHPPRASRNRRRAFATITSLPCSVTGEIHREASRGSTDKTAD